MQFQNVSDQSLGEIPMVEDELRKAAGTEENVDESMASGPTQQVCEVQPSYTDTDIWLPVDVFYSYRYRSL